MEAGDRENLTKNGDEGRYIYSVIDSADAITVDGLGIDNNAVYTVIWRDIAAAVHACRAVPYQTQDTEEAKGWVLSHCYVIDWFTNHYGTILPFSFDTVFRGGDDRVRDWLHANYDRLKGDLSRFKDKSEYSVQIFYDPVRLSETAAEGDEEIRKLKERIGRMPKGSAYLFQKKLEMRTRDLVAASVAGMAGEFGGRIRDLAGEVRVEEKLPAEVPEKFAGMRCAISLTCLVGREQVKPLGNALGQINALAGYAVRFTGPWAPFSFVDLREG